MAAKKKIIRTTKVLSVATSDPMAEFFKEENEVELGQTYARVRMDVLERFKAICKEKKITVYKGTELAMALLIKEFDSRSKKS